MRPKPNKKDTAAAQFFRGFFITLMIILPLYAAIYVFQINPALLAGDGEAVPQQGTPGEKVPVTTGGYTLLYIQMSSNNELLDAALLRFDASANRTAFCAIPHNTVLLFDKTPAQARDILRTRGALGLCDAVEQTLEVPINGYVVVGLETLGRVVDSLGSFSFTLERDVVISEGGITQYKKDQGTATLSGNDVVNILDQGGFLADERSRLLERLFESMLRSWAATDFSDNTIELYTDIVNEIETNIDAAAIYSLSRVMSAALGNPPTLESVRLGGAFVSDRFELAEDTLEGVWLLFTQANLAQEQPEQNGDTTGAQQGDNSAAAGDAAAPDPETAAEQDHAQLEPPPTSMGDLE